jgi:asparagine synthase (glutamine-hydrolysing)
MFGGYSTFREVPALLSAARTLGRWPHGAAGRAIMRWALGSETRAEKLRDVLEGEQASVVSVALSRRRLMSNAQMTALGIGDRAGEAFLPPECDPWRGVPSSSTWAGVRAVEARFYMSNMLLRDADVFGMAHGLEIRVPLLDRRVVDVALEYARSTMDLRRTPNKPWLVRALEGRIPGEVLKRRKRGFSLPQARWMRGPLRDVFEDRIHTVASSGLLDANGVRGIWHRFLREGEGPAWSRAWLLGVLGEWLGRARAGTREQAMQVMTAP